MKIDPIVRLKSFLNDSLCPTWSSQSLIDMFNDLNGNMKEKQLTILPIIDDRLSRGDHEMTATQFYFLRDITLHAVYSKTQVEFLLNDIQWLLEKFDQKQTPQRATMITMLLRQNFKQLSKEHQQKIKNLLVGTLADQNWNN